MPQFERSSVRRLERPCDKQKNDQLDLDFTEFFKHIHFGDIRVPPQNVAMNFFLAAPSSSPFLEAWNPSCVGNKGFYLIKMEFIFFTTLPGHDGGTPQTWQAPPGWLSAAPG